MTADDGWAIAALASRRQDCADIATSLAFSVAVQIQLIATLAPSTPEPLPPVQPSVAAPVPAPVSVQPALSLPAPSKAAAPPTPEPRPTERARPLKLFLGVGPSLALQLAPHPMALGRLFASGRVSWISVEIALDAALPATQREADGSGFSLDRFAAGAALCGHAWAFAACFTTTVGLLRARGLAWMLPPLRPASSPSWGPGLARRKSRSAALCRRQSRRARHALVVDGEAQ